MSSQDTPKRGDTVRVFSLHALDRGEVVRTDADGRVLVRLASPQRSLCGEPYRLAWFVPAQLPGEPTRYVLVRPLFDDSPEEGNTKGGEG